MPIADQPDDTAASTSSTADGPAPRARVPRPLLLRHGVFAPRSVLRFAVAGVLMAAIWTVAGIGLVELGPPAPDQAAHEAAVSVQTTELVRLSRTASWIGDLPVVSTVALVVVAIAYRRSRRWDLGWLTLAVIGGALAITATVKGLTDRMRPDGALTDTFSSAFPSGHAVRAAAVYALVTWLVLRWTSPHRRVMRAGVVAAAVTMTLAIGASRLVLGVHWPTDVVGGYVLGVLWLAVCVAVTQPHRAPRPGPAGSAATAGSRAAVDHQREDGSDAVALPQPPRGDGEGPSGAPDGVHEQDGARR
jgi:membrane-associated phospholipid phosphatase